MEQPGDSARPAKERAAVSRQSAVSAAAAPSDWTGPFHSEMKMEFDRKRQQNKCYFQSVRQFFP